MVRAAAKAARERDLSNVECREMDAQAIDLADGSVDGVMSRYGLILVPDRKAAFAEIRRVLRPGGALAYAVWGPWRRIPWMMMFGAVMTQQGLFTPPAEAQDDGVMPLATGDENRVLLSEAGFREIHVEVMDLPHRYTDFDHYWDVSSTIAGSLALTIACLGGEHVVAIKTALRDAVAPFRSGKHLVFPSRTILVRAS